MLSKAEKWLAIIVDWREKLTKSHIDESNGQTCFLKKSAITCQRELSKKVVRKTLRGFLYLAGDLLS